jgi:Prolyl oligopeptidase family
MRTILVVLALLLVPLAAAAVATERYSITVDGETALGYLAYPTTGSPTTLLVFGHGCCGKPNQTAFVRSYANGYGAVVVAMDYRGPGGWDVMKGHRDLIGATEDLKARFPSLSRTIIWGISMGGETTGMAVAARPDLYDYWVNTFGVTNLFEEWVALGHYGGVGDQGAIWKETGGAPAAVPQEYLVRSPALRTAEMVGIQRAYIAHGIGDLIVPYSMSRETYAGLVAAGVPVTLHTVTTGWGGQQGVYGTPAPCAPATPATPATCTPQHLATPAGNVAVPPYGPAGLAAHDGRGSAPSYQVVDRLLRGFEPDAGVAAVEHVVDYTAGVST